MLSDTDIDIYIAELEAELIESPCPCEYTSFTDAEIANIKTTTKPFRHEISATLLHRAAKRVASTRHNVASDSNLSEHEEIDLTNESRDDQDDDSTNVKFPIDNEINETNSNECLSVVPAEDTFLLTKLRQQQSTRKAMIRVQKTVRGFLARKRLQRFGCTHFAYNDQAVGCIFSDDINDLLECQNEENSSTTWKPSKPIIVAAKENADPDNFAGKSCNSSRKNERIPSNGDYHNIEPPAVPSIHRRERENGIQWRISDRQVVQVSYEYNIASKDNIICA